MSIFRKKKEVKKKTTYTITIYQNSKWGRLTLSYGRKGDAVRAEERLMDSVMGGGGYIRVENGYEAYVLDRTRYEGHLLTSKVSYE